MDGEKQLWFLASLAPSTCLEGQNIFRTKKKKDQLSNIEDTQSIK